VSAVAGFKARLDGDRRLRAAAIPVAATVGYLVLGVVLPDGAPFGVALPLVPPRAARCHPDRPAGVPGGGVPQRPRPQVACRHRRVGGLTSARLTAAPAQPISRGWTDLRPEHPSRRGR
jgi:hypothetical protein